MRRLIHQFAVLKPRSNCAIDIIALGMRYGARRE
jgi:hypothetical protein